MVRLSKMSVPSVPLRPGSQPSLGFFCPFDVTCVRFEFNRLSGNRSICPGGHPLGCNNYRFSFYPSIFKLKEKFCRALLRSAWSTHPLWSFIRQLSCVRLLLNTHIGNCTTSLQIYPSTVTRIKLNFHVSFSFQIEGGNHVRYLSLPVQHHCLWSGSMAHFPHLAQRTNNQSHPLPANNIARNPSFHTCGQSG